MCFMVGIHFSMLIFVEHCIGECMFFKNLISDIFVCRPRKICSRKMFQGFFFHILLTQYFSRFCPPRRTKIQGVFQGFARAADPVRCHFMNNFCLFRFASISTLLLVLFGVRFSVLTYSRKLQHFARMFQVICKLFVFQGVNF